jgi:hypothetical protein
MNQFTPDDIFLLLDRPRRNRAPSPARHAVVTHHRAALIAGMPWLDVFCPGLWDERGDRSADARPPPSGLDPSVVGGSQTREIDPPRRYAPK